MRDYNDLVKVAERAAARACEALITEAVTRDVPARNPAMRRWLIDLLRNA